MFQSEERMACRPKKRHSCAGDALVPRLHASKGEAA